MTITSKDSDAAALFIVDTVKHSRNELALSVGGITNIFTVFFHHIVIHFTGILMVREISGETYLEAPFPWVDSKYSIMPYALTPERFGPKTEGQRYSDWMKKFGMLPIEIGNSIPYGYRKSQLLDKSLKFLARNEAFARVFLPNRNIQIESVCSVIESLCREFNIPQMDFIVKNWLHHLEVHTSANPSVISAKGIILGTRNEFENRKKAVNFMGQDKEVVGITHGEISNSVYDEPVYGYSDLTLCTTLVDYGDYDKSGSLNTPLIDPIKNLRRSSGVVTDYYVRSERITPRKLVDSRVLYVPTMYQNNYLYGPFHACQNERYYKWQQALVRAIPDIIVKHHPKSRSEFDLRAAVEYRRLEDCLNQYEVIIFDYLATGAVLSMFTQVPVIYFDIGLRRVSTAFSRDIMRRCKVVTIDMANNLEDQIVDGLSDYHQSGNWSNTQLEKYSIAR